MSTLVEIPGKGIAEFPDDLRQSEILKSIEQSFPDLNPPSLRAEIEPPGTRTDLTKAPLAPFGDTPTPLQEEMSRRSAEARNRFEQEWPEILETLKAPEKPITQVIGDAAFGQIATLPRVPEQLSDAPAWKKIGAGGVNAVAGLAEFFLTPIGLATLGTGSLPVSAQRVIAGTFAADMIRHTPEIGRQLGEAWERGDLQKASELALTGLGTAYFTAKTGGTALKSNKTLLSERLASELERTDMVNELDAAKAPLTAQAVKQIIKPETEVPNALQQESPAVPRDVRQPEVAPESAKEVPVDASRPQVTEAQISERLGVTDPRWVELTDKVSSIARGLKAPERGDTPTPVIDTGTPIPDLQPHPISKQIFSEPFAAERLPVFGKMFGGRFSARDPVTKAIAAHAGEYYGVGKSVASALGQEIKGKISTAFSADKEGNLNVTPISEGQSLKISDVFESLQRDIDSYVLSAEQRNVFDSVIQPLLQRRTELIQQYDLLKIPDEADTFAANFPRIVTKMPQEAETATRGGERLGSKQFFQRQRAFKTEKEGWEKGYQYETDVERRIVTSIERLYKAMADKRLLSDPDLGAKSRSQLEADLRAGYAEEIGSGEMTEANIQRIADGLESKGRVFQPGAMGKIFPAEVARTLNNAFPQTESQVRRLLVEGNNFVKGLALGFDMGVSLLQGQLLAITNPRVWAKAQYNAAQALVSKQVLPEYVRANQEAVRELTQLGSNIGNLPEMLAGLESGKLATRIPGIGKAYEAFGRQFETFLDVAKVELWKGIRESTPREEWPASVQALESVLSSARMEAIGLSRNRNFMERALFMAPAYYRGAINLVAGLAERGTAGNIMRKAIASYAGGGVMAFIGLAMAAGMDDKEIVRRLNPATPEFLLITYKTEGGREVNIGFGGIHRSLLKLLGNVTRTSVEHPENWKSLAPDKNPFVRWLRGHASPTVGFAWDSFSGRDFLGRPVDITKTPENLIPIWMRPGVSKTEKVPPTLPEYAGSFFGLTAYGRTPQQQMRSLASEFNRKQGITPNSSTYEPSQFERLDWFLRLNQLDKAKAEYRLLKAKLSASPNAKSPDAIIQEHLNRIAGRNYTGSAGRERVFLLQLSPDQKAIYKIAKQEDRELIRRFLRIKDVRTK